MTRSKMIAFVGLVLFLTGLVVTGLSRQFTLISLSLCLLGALAGSTLFFSGVTRNLRLYLNMALYSGFFLASLLVLFLIVQRHPFSYDATRDKLYSISPVTQSFLKRLPVPVRVTAFATEADKDGVAQFLDEYVRHSHYFSFQIVNPFRDQATARRYDMRVMPGDVYVESVTTDTKTAGRAVKVGRLNEEELTNGIVQLLRGKDISLYFLTGHGELSMEKSLAAKLGGRPQTADQLVWLKEQLERSYIKVLTLPLAQRGRVPVDADAVVCVAPKTDLTSAEQQALRAYLDAGGKALFLLNPEFPQMGGELRTSLRNFSSLLESYGLMLENKIAVMPLQQGQGTDIFTVPVQFSPHRVTQFSDDELLFFNQARPVSPLNVLPPNVRVEPILKTPPSGWLMPMEELTQAYVTRQRPSIKVDPKQVAAHTLGAAVTVQPFGTSLEKSTRLVVIGNGNFVSSEYISQKGWLLFSNAINWLTDTGDLIAIPTPRIENTPIAPLSDGEKQFLFLLLVIAMPTLIGLVGVGYSVSKRELQ